MTELVLIHTDKGGLHYKCRIEPSETPLGVKFFCPKCKRYAKADAKHHFQWWTFKDKFLGRWENE